MTDLIDLSKYPAMLFDLSIRYNDSTGTPMLVPVPVLTNDFASNSGESNLIIEQRKLRKRFPAVKQRRTIPLRFEV